MLKYTYSKSHNFHTILLRKCRPPPLFLSSTQNPRSLSNSEDRQVHYTAGALARRRCRANLFFTGTGSIRGTLPAFYHRIGGSTPV